jgi:regulator of PEP synthase PpsR (kinase-PPPase family)
VAIVPHVRQVEQIEDVLREAGSTNGTIVHTLVDDHLRAVLVERARQQGIVAIDLMGPLLSRLTGVLRQEPITHPGLYRQLHQAYFDRVAAIEYSMTHDDGRRAEDWPQAEIVLAGVSRIGKTPLSMYLAVLGWKVANVPLVPGLPTPPGLYQLERRRVIGLTMEAGQLLFHRRQRRQRLHAPGLENYVDPAKISQELESAEQAFRRGGFSVIDVTDKPIEASAEQVIDLITRRLGERAHVRSRV